MGREISTRPEASHAVTAALWPALCRYETLDDAWHKVRQNHGGPGGDGVTVDEFARNAAARLAQLLRDLRQGTYHPGPPRHTAIPKRKGGTRPLDIPCVSDRIVQTAATELLAPVLDREMEDASFAYRPGRSVEMAVARVAALRAQGLTWVVESDIERYFENVPHARLMARLVRSVGDARLCALVEMWLATLAPGGQGLPQGAPISPLLANLYLDEVDERIEAHGVRLVRFGDDFVLLCRSEAAAEGALGRVRMLLSGLGLALHPDKTRIVPFEQSFRFLGHLFVRSVVLRSPEPEPPPAGPVRAARLAASLTEPPPLAEDAPRVEVDEGKTLAPVLRPLYVLQPGRVLDARHDTFVVTENGRAVLAVHATMLDRIEIGPDVVVSDAALRLALASRIDLAFVTGGGNTLGVLIPPVRDDASLHLAQARHALDRALRADLARRFVTGRLRNQRAQLNRLNRTRDDPELVTATKTLGRALDKLPKREGTALMGLEGAATAVYWRALGRTLVAGWSLPRRRRRPPPDPVNLAISFLSTLLLRDMAALVLRRGLHPGIGMLHAARDDAPACAFDLMEEFRAPLAEGLAVYLCNNRMLKPEMFSTDETGGCRVDLDGRRALVRAYEAKLEDVRPSLRGRHRVRWRGVMDEQVLAFRAHLTGGPPYAPYDMGY